MEANSQSLADLMASVGTAANQPGVSVVSMSWGFPEGQAVLAQDEALYDGYFTTPAGHTPVTFVASTGDYGTADPEYPSFSPNVVAVGGTSLYLNADNSYKNETGWGYFSNQVGAFIGSGGGVSLYEPQPVYQAGVQTTGLRTTPDVSFVADPGTGAWIADTYNLGSDNPWEVVGGTSLSAPSWAGLMALVDQGRVAAGATTLSSNGGTETQQALYGLSAADFNSITSGTNGGFTAAAGYNMVTGLGTPIANLLVPDLIAYQGTSATNASAAAGGASAQGQGSINVLNVFDAVVSGLRGQGNFAIDQVGLVMPATAGQSPPSAGVRTAPADSGRTLHLAPSLSLDPAVGSGSMVEGAAFLLPSGAGAVFQAPAASRGNDPPTASWLPAASDPVWTPGVPLTPIAVWPRPDLTADTIDDLLIGKPASDPLVGDPLDGGNAGEGAEMDATATGYPAALDAILAGGWQAATRLPFGQTLAPGRVVAPAADAVIGDDYFLPGGDGSDGADDSGLPE